MNNRNRYENIVRKNSPPRNERLNLVKNPSSGSRKRDIISAQGKQRLLTPDKIIRRDQQKPVNIPHGNQIGGRKVDRPRTPDLMKRNYIVKKK